MNLIPLSSQSDAKNAIIQAKESLRKEVGRQDGVTDNSDTSDDEDVQPEDGHAEDDEPRSVASASPVDAASVPLPAGKDVNTSVAEDVIGRRGQYGRFAERWFSKKGWSTEKKRAQGMSADAIGKSEVNDGDGDGDNENAGSARSYASAMTQGMNGVLSSKKESTEQSSGKNQAESLNANDVTVTLLPKLLRTTKMLFGSRSFFFSYDYDLTRRLGSQEVKNPEIPMHKIVDPLVSASFNHEYDYYLV